MKAKVLHVPDNTIEIMYTAARTCYSSHTPTKIDNMLRNKDQGEKEHLVKAVLDMGHWSIAEQVEVTIALENIPRSMSHQLVRHRLAAYAQQSQRYVTMSSEDVDKMLHETVPPRVERNNRAYHAYQKAIRQDEESYHEIYEALLEEGYTKEEAKEDARSVLPNSCPTNIVTTKNLRQIAHECSIRLCKRTQYTTRDLYEMLRDDLVKYLPLMENYLKPKCFKFRLCDEGKKSCGMFPVISTTD